MTVVTVVTIVTVVTVVTLVTLVTVVTELRVVTKKKKVFLKNSDKLKKSIYDKNLKTQIVTKLKNPDCDKTQKLKL